MRTQTTLRCWGTGSGSQRQAPEYPRHLPMLGACTGLEAGLWLGPRSPTDHSPTEAAVGGEQLLEGGCDPSLGFKWSCKGGPEAENTPASRAQEPVPGSPAYGKGIILHIRKE